MYVRSAVLRFLSWSALALLSLTALPATAGAQPVSHDFFDGARAEVANPGGSYPGSNDFSCRPSMKHPNPVVLVHGTGGNRQTNWATMIPALRNEGYCVFALTYGTLPGTVWPVSGFGGLTRMEDSAEQLASFIARVRQGTGAARVDLVGHSEGTLMPTYYLKYLGGAQYVDRYVSLAPYWKGQDQGCVSAAGGDGEGFRVRSGPGVAVSGMRAGELWQSVHAADQFGWFAVRSGHFLHQCDDEVRRYRRAVDRRVRARPGREEHRVAGHLRGRPV
ncbi:esterase/lipase family protein [Gordonia rubripertincta]|uniref:Alpha/beta fold hydrolase n=1 Tax=Gordonia rubripertincta TaxID=36822 RepID=A0ABT4N1Y6_GORRU|nr:alpha/beta fold hydrolase [Gordonia rubripertincta]MCZ4553279.1 alpha/beta fold hydrolase [Gordonia rubripertincta]